MVLRNLKPDYIFINFIHEITDLKKAGTGKTPGLPFAFNRLILKPFTGLILFFDRKHCRAPEPVRCSSHNLPECFNKVLWCVEPKPVGHMRYCNTGYFKHDSGCRNFLAGNKL